VKREQDSEDTLIVTVCLSMAMSSHITVKEHENFGDPLLSIGIVTPLG
jgi:hypothetical protein